MSARQPSPRPVCLGCGRRYGQRWTDEQEMVLPVGQSPDWPPTTRQVVRVWKTPYGVRGDKAMERHFRALWDGSWLRPYEPFCTLRCALAYARRVAKASGRWKP